MYKIIAEQCLADKQGHFVCIIFMLIKFPNGLEFKKIKKKTTFTLSLNLYNCCSDWKSSL